MEGDGIMARKIVCPKCGNSEASMDKEVSWKLTCKSCGEKYVEPLGHAWWWGHDDN